MALRRTWICFIGSFSITALVNSSCLYFQCTSRTFPSRLILSQTILWHLMVYFSVQKLFDTVGTKWIQKSTLVNLINNWRATFVPIFFQQKITKLNCCRENPPETLLYENFASVGLVIWGRKVLLIWMDNTEFADKTTHFAQNFGLICQFYDCE